MNCLYLKYCTIYRRYERNPQSGNAVCALRPFTIVEVEELQRIPRKEAGVSQFSEKGILYFYRTHLA